MSGFRTMAHFNTFKARKVNFNQQAEFQLDILSPETWLTERPLPHWISSDIIMRVENDV